MSLLFFCVRTIFAFKIRITKGRIRKSARDEFVCGLFVFDLSRKSYFSWKFAATRVWSRWFSQSFPSSVNCCWLPGENVHKSLRFWHNHPNQACQRKKMRLSEFLRANVWRHAWRDCKHDATQPQSAKTRLPRHCGISKTFLFYIRVYKSEIKSQKMPDHTNT